MKKYKDGSELGGTHTHRDTQRTLLSPLNLALVALSVNTDIKTQASEFKMPTSEDISKCF